MSIVEGVKMNLKRIIVIALLISLLFPLMAKAEECTYQQRAEMNSYAAQVKATYEIKTGILDSNMYLEAIDDIKYDYLESSVYNLSENLYLIIKNNLNEDEIKVNYTDTNDGSYTFKWSNEDEIVVYSIEIYSSENTNCPNEKLKVISLKIPKRNPYANLAICQDTKDLNLCQPYILFNEPTSDELISKIEAYKKGEIDSNSTEIPKEEKNNLKTFIKNNKIAIITTSSVIVVIIIVGIVLVTTKKKRKGRRKVHEKF